MVNKLFIMDNLLTISKYKKKNLKNDMQINKIKSGHKVEL